MNVNADVTSRRAVAGKMMKTILNMQPRLTSGLQGKTSDEMVLETLDSLKKRIPENLDSSEASRKTFTVDSKVSQILSRQS